MPWTKQQTKDYNKQYRATHQEKIKANRIAYREKHRKNTQAWREDNRYDYNAYNRKYRAKNQDAYNEYARNYARKRKYGLSKENYTKRLKKQKGCCAICKRLETRKVKGRIAALTVDHNHTTQQIRGLLCTRCNFDVAYFEIPFSTEKQKRILSYLEFWRKETKDEAKEEPNQS